MNNPMDHVQGPAADVVELNRQLFDRWHELDAELTEALAAGDAGVSGAAGAAGVASAASAAATVAKLRRERDEVGAQFLRQNLPYARHLAGKWVRVNPGNRDDYLAAAYEKLWSAFLSWEPDKGTFSTWARSHIEGGVRREVRRQEFSERSYDDFNARPVLQAAKEKLAIELGRSPSLDELRAETGMPVAEVERLTGVADELAAAGLKVSPARVAARSGVSAKQAERFLSSRARLRRSLEREPSAEEISVDTGLSKAVIERALTPRAARLDAPVSADADTTLADRLSQRLSDEVVLEDDAEWVAYLAEVCEPLNGQQLWAVLRLEGLDGASPQKMRDVAAQLDVGRETVRRSDTTARKLLAGPLPQRIE